MHVSYKRKRFSKLNSGVTFLELIIVISLMAIVFAILIPGYNHFRRRQAAANAAMDFKYNILRTQRMSQLTEDVYRVEVNRDKDTVSIYTVYGPVNPTVLLRDYRISDNYFGTSLFASYSGGPGSPGVLNFYPGGNVDGNLEKHTYPGYPTLYYISFSNGNSTFYVSVNASSGDVDMGEF